MSFHMKCDWCGKPVRSYPSDMKKKHRFCSRSCQDAFRNKRSNPERYKEYGDYSKNGQRFSEMNRKMNPTRMTPETRAKLRAARLDSGHGKTYAKTYGRHTHRVIAEQILGRPLKRNEVVHHIDGNKRNNTPENLLVMTHSEHSRLHMMQRLQKEVTDNAI